MKSKLIEIILIGFLFSPVMTNLQGCRHLTRSKLVASKPGKLPTGWQMPFSISLERNLRTQCIHLMIPKQAPPGS